MLYRSAGLGDLLKNVRKDYEAVDQFREVIRMQRRTHARAHNNLAMLLKNVRKDTDGAEREFREAIRIDPQDSRAHYNLAGLLYSVKTDYDGAEKEYRETIRFQSSCTRACTCLLRAAWHADADADIACMHSQHTYSMARHHMAQLSGAR